MIQTYVSISGAAALCLTINVTGVASIDKRKIFFFISSFW